MALRGHKCKLDPNTGDVIHEEGEYRCSNHETCFKTLRGCVIKYGLILNRKSEDCEEACYFRDQIIDFCERNHDMHTTIEYPYKCVTEKVNLAFGNNFIYVVKNENHPTFGNDDNIILDRYWDS